MDSVIVLVSTIVAITASVYLFALSQVDHLKKNWVQYRCNPLYMPVAGLVGDDVVSNFTKCTMTGFQSYAGFIMDPVMSEFSVVSDTIGEIGSSMNSMRNMMGSVRGGFLGIVGSVFGKIQNVMAQTQYIIIRMRTVLSRIVGIMFSFVYIFYGGMQTGQSVVNGPVGKTMNFLCFDENTTVDTTEGVKKMKDLALNDRLQENMSLITSIYKLDGTGVQMYNLYNIIVSGSHKVRYNNKFIRVDKHPRARKALKQSKNLICLNTANNRITIRGTQFLDFTESNDADFMLFKNNYIESLYNGSGNKSYTQSTGLVYGTLVSTSNGKIPVEKIKIGQQLEDANVVKGIAYHYLGTSAVYVELAEGILASPSTWVLTNNKIYRAGDIGRHQIEPTLHHQVIIQLITEKSMYPIVNNKGHRMFVLDELETTEEFYHTLKDTIITTGTFRGKRIVI